MKIAIYARVSTQRQADEDRIDNQLLELRQFCRIRGYEIYKEYCDNGLSGATMDKRPALQELFKDASAHKFQAIIVFQLSRFSRSLSDLLTSLDRLAELEISFISIKEAFDVTTSTGKLLVSILGALSEFERQLLRERIKAGVNRKRAEGKEFGNKKIKLTADTLRYIVEQKEKGNSLRRIGLQIGLSSTRVAQNPKMLKQVHYLQSEGFSPDEIADKIGSRRSYIKMLVGGER